MGDCLINDRETRNGQVEKKINNACASGINFCYREQVQTLCGKLTVVTDQSKKGQVHPVITLASFIFLQNLESKLEFGQVNRQQRQIFRLE